MTNGLFARTSSQESMNSGFTYDCFGSAKISQGEGRGETPL
jgi:hypothetical protein